MNSCKCNISPRPEYRDFINVCIECGGRGGSSGNVSHNYGCSNLYCVPSDWHCCEYRNYPTQIEYIKGPGIYTQISGSFNWSTQTVKGPIPSIIAIHKESMNTKKHEILLARFKMHKSLMEIVYYIIELKTGCCLKPSRNKKSDLRRKSNLKRKMIYNTL